MSKITIGAGATGTLSYNGFNFDGAVNITCSSNPIPDEAKLTVTCVEITINVSFIFASEDGDGNQMPTDEDIEDLRAKLSQVGKHLKFINKGFGDDIDLNGPQSRKRDVKHGPHPGVLTWEPVGDNYACLCNWSVKTYMSQCPYQNQNKSVGMMAMNFDMSFDIDEEGDCVRTVSGYLEVTQSRKGRKITNTADYYWQFIKLQPLSGWRRRHRRSLNKDKSRLNFTVIDRQEKSRNPYPSHINVASGRHRVSWNRNSMAEFRNNLSVELTPDAYTNPEYAWVVFIQICRQRMWKSIKAGRTVLLDSLSAEEDIFGRPCSFQAGWRILGCVQDFLGDSGIWQPIGTDWRWWTHSMGPTMMAQYGWHGAHHSTSMDAIIDLCVSDTVKTREPGQQYTSGRKNYKMSLRNDMPKPKDSYIMYENEVIPRQQSPVTKTSVLQEPPKKEKKGAIPDDGYIDKDGFIIHPDNPYTWRDVIETDGGPSTSVRLKGRAIRAGYEVPKPKMIEIGGEPTHEVDAIYVMKPVANWLGVPIFAAEWDIEYLLEKPPKKKLEMPDRPERS